MIEKDRPEFIWASHKESNILVWSFLVAPPDDTVYRGGWYWGRLKFPSEYPMMPPSITVVTPSGRFATNTKICLSISDFHPESWNPALQVSTILKGVLSFMLGDELTTGAVEASDAERRRLAGESVAWNKRHPEFSAYFPNFDELRATEADRRERLARDDASKRREALVARGDFVKALDTCEGPERADIERARDRKAAGDAKFRSGDFTAAIDEYSAAADIRCAALLRNRAAAYERLGDHARVVADCAAALAIDADVGEPVSFKALVRRAAAYENLGRPRDAIADLEKAISLEGQDDNKLQDARRKLEMITAAHDAATTDSEKNKRKNKKKKKRKKKKEENIPIDDDDDAGEHEDDEEDDDRSAAPQPP
ncbi:hypothetical protein CTAYLR_009903 [Chrysophaeum taylorii]|uniref:UBC core domain-containing protein n=1 Tax=Chrysophaeum taylorii TaxID=2483200 RepID=A0AAD7XNV2_9STRA|nr:hypothetical protein CTAYLR_009903 [Chrysophaeum taylorii]